jgi:hypothetical protein
MAFNNYPPIKKQAIPEGMAWMEKIYSIMTGDNSGLQT